ncbi:hypothetical protein HYS31_01120 [Candidatus Woesearchaeota archaeon]|nr:hypothetical protein [Candidatus Woesearchaeota archaeon]
MILSIEQQIDLHIRANDGTHTLRRILAAEFPDAEVHVIYGQDSFIHEHDSPHYSVWGASFNDDRLPTILKRLAHEPPTADRKMYKYTARFGDLNKGMSYFPQGIQRFSDYDMYCACHELKVDISNATEEFLRRPECQDATQRELAIMSVLSELLKKVN